MTDTDTPTPAPAEKPWIRRRTTQAGIVLLLLLVWSIAAQRWADKGCDLMPQSYGLVVTHFGTPAGNEGCESEPDGPAYTDQYGG
jgi:hypothetical protein